MSNIDPTCSRRRPTSGRAAEPTWIVGAGILGTLSIHRADLVCSYLRSGKISDWWQLCNLRGRGRQPA